MVLEYIKKNIYSAIPFIKPYFEKSEKIKEFLLEAVKRSGLEPTPMNQYYLKFKESLLRRLECSVSLDKLVRDSLTKDHVPELLRSSSDIITSFIFSGGTHLAEEDDPVNLPAEIAMRIYSGISDIVVDTKVIPAYLELCQNKNFRVGNLLKLDFADNDKAEFITRYNKTKRQVEALKKDGFLRQAGDRLYLSKDVDSYLSFDPLLFPTIIRVTKAPAKTKDSYNYDEIESIINSYVDKVEKWKNKVDYTIHKCAIMIGEREGKERKVAVRFSDKKGLFSGSVIYTQAIQRGLFDRQDGEIRAVFNFNSYDLMVKEHYSQLAEMI